MTRAARRRLLVAAAGLLVLGVAGGVLYAVQSPEQVAAPAHVAACETPMSRMPPTVGGQRSRGVSVAEGTDPRDVREWGDPAIIATCGWPALGPTSDQCLDVDGVDWVAQELSDGVRFTTFGRDPAIEVLVPDAYAPAPLLLPAFNDAAKALPGNNRTCS
ncbi:DUF3515 family protein [Phycicoccus sp. Root101]|uniref:DUF3515 family protein n=1 Tax=Phycicoccus sp. Root101 TaxID=1736421 RepID=UPI0007025F43|nr:DUF3515 family protein [Phycicoccus sp. Root101]KQU70625.1 hypothetical protein ASC58_02175 [Phycicoccus sp. Root101]